MSNDHHHHHDHKPQGEMPLDEKLLKLIAHWIKHNEEHAVNYRNWAEKAKANGQVEAGALINEAAEVSLAINQKLQKASALIGSV